MSQVIQFEQGSPQWHAYRKRAVTDLYWFAEVILGHGRGGIAAIPMTRKVHYAFCRFIEGRTGHPALDEAPIRLTLMPRDTGKTSIQTKARPIQLLCANPNRAIVIANEKEDNARKFLDSIKGQFESNELLRGLFPEVLPENFQDTVWRGTEIKVKRTTNRQEPSILATGVGGSVVGMHPDDLFLDDIISIEAMRNAQVGARQIINEVNQWITTLIHLPNKNAVPRWSINLTGTHWWNDDCYEFAIKFFSNGETPRRYLIRHQNDDGTTQTVTAYRAGDIAWLVRSAIEDGQSIFPDKWDLETLAKMRVRDPVLFAANLMNQPNDEVTSQFKESWLKQYQWTEGNAAIRWTDSAGKIAVTSLASLDRLIVVDPGGFGTTAGQKGDRARAAAILTGSTGDFQSHFVLKAYSDRDTYLACIREVVSWVSQHTPRKVVVEQTGQQMAFVDKLKEELAKARLAVPVETITPKNKDKDLRILELEPYFQQGQVYIGSGPEWLEFRQQYAQWPRAMRRDLLDVLAYGPVVWRKPQQGSTLSHENRQRLEEQRYLQMRFGR